MNFDVEASVNKRTALQGKIKLKKRLIMIHYQGYVGRAEYGVKHMKKGGVRESV